MILKDSITESIHTEHHAYLLCPQFMCVLFQALFHASHLFELNKAESSSLLLCFVIWKFYLLHLSQEICQKISTALTDIHFTKDK